MIAEQGLWPVVGQTEDLHFKTLLVQRSSGTPHY